jgi:hypothetical protein
LKFFSSVPFCPAAGLVPEKGDILFWNRHDHVAVSLGRTFVDGSAKDEMMSVWTHNFGKFSRLDLEEMPPHLKEEAWLRFVPCPFGGL